MKRVKRKTCGTCRGKGYVSYVRDEKTTTLHCIDCKGKGKIRLDKTKRVKKELIWCKHCGSIRKGEHPHT